MPTTEKTPVKETATVAPKMIGGFAVREASEDHPEIKERGPRNSWNFGEFPAPVDGKAFSIVVPKEKAAGATASAHAYARKHDGYKFASKGIKGPDGKLTGDIEIWRLA